jgi:hypothetical protein
MFDIDEAIKQWRRKMQSAGINSSESLDELEAHLRDEVARQTKAGLSAEKAFDAAVQQIGQAETVGAEFAKTSERKTRRERKLKLLCLAYMGLCYPMPLVLSASHIREQLDSTQCWLVVAAVAVTEISLFSGLFLYRLLPVIPDKRIRTRVQFLSALPLFIWLLVFAYGILGRLELTLGQIMVVTLWSITPLAVFGGLIVGLDEAVHRRRFSGSD